MFESSLKEVLPEFLEDLEKRRVQNDGNFEDDWHPILFYEKIDGTHVPLAAKGELIVIAGGKKARKSLLASIMVASRYADMGVDRSTRLGFLLDIPDGDILYFDTEQPRSRVKRNRKRYQSMIKDADGDDTSFIQYSLRGLSPEQMIRAINVKVDRMINEGRIPEWIIIDQVADLLTSRDENDKVEASRILDELISLQERTGALITVMIHTNRAELNSNGKLGSLLDQKNDCQFLLTYDFENQETELEQKFSRERKMPKIRFHQNEWGYPEFLNEKQYF